MKNKAVIFSSRIIFPDGISEGRVFVENGKISAIENKQQGYQKNTDGYQVIDTKNNYLSPGFFEIHFHGQGGFNLENINNLQDQNNLSSLDDFLKEKGINTYLPTFSYNEVAIEKCVSIFEELNLFNDRIPGIYIEGPFISPEKKGALEKEYIKEVKPEELEQFKNFYHKIGNRIKMLTIAPEKENVSELYDFCQQQNIIISFGHSNCLLEDAKKSLEKINLNKNSTHKNFINLTHLFNAMSPIKHRGAGLATLPFINEDVFFEVITDGIHIQDEILEMIQKKLNRQKMIVVSDSTSCAGCPSGNYQHLGKKIISDEEGVFYEENGLPNRNLFVGSRATLSECLNYFVNQTECEIHEAIAMVTNNPANLLNLQDRGEILVGKKADLILLNDKMECVDNLFDLLLEK